VYGFQRCVSHGICSIGGISLPEDSKSSECPGFIPRFAPGLQIVSIVASGFLYGNNCGQRLSIVVAEDILMAGFQAWFKNLTELAS
jgi:hypothetical protein